MTQNDPEILFQKYQNALRFVETVDDMFPPEDWPGYVDLVSPPKSSPPASTAQKIGELVIGI